MTNFIEGTRVQIAEGHPHANKSGHIERAKANGMNALIRLDIGGTTYAQDSQLIGLPVVGVGDLVRVKAFGKWQAQEGHIVSDNIGTFTVDFGYEEKAAFGATALEVIEKVKPLRVRIEGQPIKPEAIKRGDKISVVSTEENEIKRTTILEAVVDKIVLKSFGSVIIFQTRSGAQIFASDSHNKSVVTLLRDIDKDEEFQTLSQAKLGDIIAFPDEDGGVETNIAVKQGDDFWSVILGTKKAKTVETVGLVNILKKLSVAFTVVRSAPVKEKPFPVGTHVKVNPAKSPALSGDYRVVIAGDDQSTIKSRGISAATHSVPNEWLTKS